MKSISGTAEDVNPTAPNNSDSAESDFTPESTSDRSQDKSGKIHSFSCKLAREIQKLKKKLTGKEVNNGSHYATVVKYLANRVGNSKNDVGGKKWFYITIKDLKKQYPYFSESALLSIVHTLNDIGYCEIANHNKYKYDKTFWYHVPTHIRNAAEEEPRYFDSAIATKHGVPTAVLIDNFEYWLDQCEVRGLNSRLRMSPRILVELLPFSERTIKRGLDIMVEANYASKLSETKPLFGKPLIKSVPNQRLVVPKQILVVPDQRLVVPNQSHDTYYKPINNLLEICSKGNLTVSDTNTLSETNQFKGLIPESFAGVKRANIEINELLVKLQKDHQDKLCILASNASYEFLKAHEEFIYDWSDIEDTELLFQNIKAVFPAFLKQQNIDKWKSVIIKSMLTSGTLETIIGAFIFNSPANYYAHHIPSLLKHIQRSTQYIYSTVDDERERRMKQTLAERRVKYASPDENKEYDDCLTPIEKARVFRNALSSRNKIGWLCYDCDFRTDIISISKSGTLLIQKLFEHNEDAVPGDLINIMDQCVEAYISEPEPPAAYVPGVRWHARKGATNVLLFARYLKAIVQDLGIGDGPIQTFLGDISQEQQEEHSPAALTNG